jgi:light-regulated signal transduction histidine kinase (bacteriophytochrome)
VLIVGGFLNGSVKSIKRFLPVNLEHVVENSIEQYRISDPHNNAFFKMEMLPIIDGDGKMLRALFDELISNALKFKRENVRSIVEIFGQKEKNKNWRISIFDNGIGFDQKVLSQIFITSSEDNQIEDEPFSGKGLKLCKEIVDYHNGCIYGKSIIGHGAKFTIRLPEKQN